MNSLKYIGLLMFVAFLSSLSLNAATSTLFVGQTYQTEISSTGYHYLSIESVSSTNPSVSVTKMGLVVKATVNAYFSGEATITIRLRYQLYAGQSYQYRNQEFTIECSDTQVNISPTTISIEPGETYQLSYGFNRSTYITPSLQWTSSDEAIVSVSSAGLIVAKTEGVATIYLRSNLGSNTSECQVKVSGQSSVGDGSAENPSVGDDDRSWYNTLSNEFHISRSEEFVGLMSMVAEGNTFSGKTIYLDDDVDLSSLNWTTPIGINEKNPFSGTFDGQNHNINYKIEFSTNNIKYQYEAFYGLFGYTDGKLKNFSTTGHIKITAASDIQYIYIGGIVGKIFAASLENCCNNVSIEYNCVTSYTKFAYLGGIVGRSDSGYISSCINMGNVDDRTNVAGNKEYNNHFLGGICGVSNASIDYCYNSGTIECVPNDSYNTQNNTTAVIGGIIGSLMSYSRCRYSGNVGSVLGSAEVVKLGGIGGVIQSEVVVVDCYVACPQLGDLLNRTSTSSCIGLLGGDTNSSSSYIYNFVASDILKYNIRNGRSADESYSISDMKTDNFVSVMNSYSQTYSHYIGGYGLFPLPQPSVFLPQYYVTTVENIACTSALLKSNANQILGPDILSCGFLIRQDDGKEYFRQCEPGKFQVELNDLIPNRTYYVRWFAKDSDFKEYYGYETNFATKPINPTTLEVEANVFSAKLRGKYYVPGVSKVGFYIKENNEEAIGKYCWKNAGGESDFEIEIKDLRGNSEYSCQAVIELKGIYYEGNEIIFSTKTMSVLEPSDFTSDGVLLNGEIGIEVSSAWFEFRSDLWPSVIDSEIVPINNLSVGKVYAQSPILQLGDSYKYRLAIQDVNETIYSDWIEFLFSIISIDAESILLSQTEAELKVGESLPISATVLPEDATDKTVIWTSDNEAVATVDANGNVTAISIGSVTITASCGEVSAACAVTVVATPVESISLSQTEAQLKVGESVTLTATVLPENATDKTVIWTSDNEAVSTVDADGNVTSVSIGTATITAFCGDVSASCAVSVEPILVESIQLTPDSWIGEEGESFIIFAVILPEEATDKSLIWSSSDESIAIVDAEGNVSVLKEGSCVIIATASDGSGIFAECVLTSEAGVERMFSDSDILDIYDFNGIMIKKDADNEDLKMLTPGIYILRSGAETRKLIIR